MKTSEKRFSKAYGQWKVVLAEGVVCEPFQDIKQSDIVERLHYNRFSYESYNCLYDVEVYFNGNVKYYINMKIAIKNNYHIAIEKKYQDDITKTTKELV